MQIVGLVIKPKIQSRWKNAGGKKNARLSGQRERFQQEEERERESRPSRRHIQIG